MFFLVLLFARPGYLVVMVTEVVFLFSVLSPGQCVCR